MGTSHDQNERLRKKYRLTSLFYDFLDYPWERQYRVWRPRILHDVSDAVLEAGVGTGRNLRYYPSDARVTGIDLSEMMLKRAKKRAALADCSVELVTADGTDLHRFADSSFDWYVSTFMYCVMPDSLQPEALREMARVLRPGGRFRLVEIVYSSNPRLRHRQRMFAPFVERVYGARFDRNTLFHIQQTRGVRVVRTSYLKDDTYLLIEGEKT